MAKKSVKAPLRPAFKQFFSLREVHVSSTSGHSAIIPSNKPTELPRQLWQDAYKAGAMEYDPELIRAAARAIEKGTETALTFDGALTKAVGALVASGTPADLNKNTGVPKIGSVRQAMTDLGVNPKGLTNAAICDTFQAISSESDEDEQEEPDTTDLEDEDGVNEPVGAGVAGLVGEAEEGDTDEE